jgi:GH15 family glucan-1,4-alpha-glucosidase
VYGELMDALLQGREGGLPPEEASWRLQLALLDFLEGEWDEPDEGIWEVRGERRHFVHSKVMAWVAFDRGVRTAERFETGDGPVDRWRELRERIHREVCERGFDAERGTFTQSYGSRGLDAATLMIPLVGFLPPGDERVRATVLAIADELTEHGLVLRYRVDETEDGLSGKEGTFTICSFWLVSALSEIGEPMRARKLCARVLTHMTTLGLYAEEIDALSGAQLGNFPQAFTHLALINAVSHVIADEQRGDRDQTSAVFTELRAAGAAG